MNNIINKQSIENFTWEELFDFHGYEVEYCIQGNKGIGKLSVNKKDERIYICQDKVKGFSVPDKLGFRFSYVLEGCQDVGNYFINCIKFIYVPEKTFNKKELLEEAKRRYPVGTIIKLANGNITDVKENLYFDTSCLNVIWNDGYGMIYDNGKWAEIISEPEEKVEEIPQFEVGKWYKYNEWYLKYSHTRDDIFIASEYISYDKKYVSNLNNFTCGFADNDKVLITDLSEIQQYLPDGHPDKVIKAKSLVGRYLKALVDYPNSGDVKKGEYGKIINNYTADFPSQKNYACEVAISKLNDSNTIYDDRYELMPEGFNPDEVKEEIPEYVECVKSYTDVILGKIYKVTSKGNVIDEKLETHYFWNAGGFKPSTKEAYDKQQRDLEIWKGEVEQLKEEWIPKVGDWVVVTHSKRDYETDQKEFIGQIDKYENPSDYWIKNHNLDGKYKTYKSICCDNYPFRKAEPHEIPKENNTIKETKPEIDSWCVKATKENQELLKQNRQFFNVSNYQFSDFGKYYGITKKGKFDIYNNSSYFDKVLTTEEFCKKFNITQSSKYELLDTFEVTLIDEMKPLQEEYNHLQDQLQSKIQNNKEENNKTEELMYKTKTIKTFNRNF